MDDTLATTNTTISYVERLQNHIVGTAFINMIGVFVIVIYNHCKCPL